MKLNKLGFYMWRFIYTHCRNGKNAFICQKNHKMSFQVIRLIQIDYSSIYSSNHFYWSYSIPECKWNGDCIIVMDDVQIEPPYKPENCSGQKKDSLAHIRKMVGHVLLDLISFVCVDVVCRNSDVVLLFRF